MTRYLIAYCVGLFFIWSGNGQAQESLAQINSDINYLRENVIEVFDYNNQDIQRAEHVISRLTQVLETDEWDIEAQVLLRRVRALSLKNINLFRLNSGQRVDYVQAEVALKDIEFVSQHTGSDYILYAGGLIAIHLLNYPVKAYEFWQKCAESGHAGCMNIMANHRFTGENGLPIDVSQTVYWHQKVFQTGIDFRCAGVYSAINLGELAFLYDDIDTGTDWETWRERRALLLEEVTQKTGDDYLCKMGVHYFRDFVFQSIESGTDWKMLDLAIEHLPEKSEKESLQIIKQNVDLSDAIEHLALINNPIEQCSLTLSLILYAQNVGQSSAHQALQDYMTTLSTDDCAWEFALLQRIQNFGRWQTIGRSVTDSSEY
ncbi:hypothetical protein L1D32_04640 [Shewanella insulae]|uniref:hypothetical protein n=1 Tax=Shewanella insulae TaxID=2681496 RepID=UPI001EFD2F1E|nr:hypothetical protein [Shewanella insulae]MCG9737447.1 hypothetical protein [Shewanella insulae]